MAILVFIEQKGGLVRTVAREALGEAVRLAATLGGPVVGVCAAAADPGLAALGEAGASELLLATHASFGHYEPAGYARAVVAAVEKVKPAVVLFSASAMGRDLAPRVAARLGVGLAADCTALAVEGARLIASRPVYAGKAVQRVAFTASVSAGTTSKASPTTPKSATLKMGASGSLLIATMQRDDDIPARCWMAPEMATAT